MFGFEHYFLPARIASIEDDLDLLGLKLPDLSEEVGKMVAEFCKDTGYLPSRKNMRRMIGRAMEDAEIWSKI